MRVDRLETALAPVFLSRKLKVVSCVLSVPPPLLIWTIKLPLTGVFVGPGGVLVRVAVGAMDVLVGVDGIDVFVRVAVGPVSVLVAVGGTGVLVRVAVAGAVVAVGPLPTGKGSTFQMELPIRAEKMIA